MISGEISDTKVVLEQGSGDCIGIRSSDNNNFTHCSTVAKAVMAWYSISVEERETMRCFVELQEIGLAPGKIRKAPVEV